MSYLRVVFRGRPVAPPEMDLDAECGTHEARRASRRQAAHRVVSGVCLVWVTPQAHIQNKQAQDKFHRKNLGLPTAARPSSMRWAPQDPREQRRRHHHRPHRILATAGVFEI